MKTFKGIISHMGLAVGGFQWLVVYFATFMDLFI